MAITASIQVVSATRLRSDEMSKGRTFHAWNRYPNMERSAGIEWYPMPISQLFNTLSVRDFRWLWGSSVIHVVGMSTEFLVQGWMVLLITESPLWVGIASGIRGAGNVGTGIMGGVLADRIHRRNVLATVHWVRGMLLAGLAFLVLTDMVQLWHILAAALFQGMADGLTAPSHNGLIYDTLGPRRLLNGLATMLAGFHLSWMIGSVVTGTVISILGIGTAYVVAAGAYLLSPVALLLVKAGEPVQRHQESVWRNIVEGLRYVSGSRLLRVMLLLSVLVETFGFSYSVMLPVIAKNVLHVGPSGLGYLSAAGSVGALVGTVMVAGLSDLRAKWTMLTVSTSMAGISLVLFGISPWFITSLILATAVGLALVVYDASINALLQLLSDDKLRGRVLGLYGLTWGFTPVGGLIAGAIASVASAPFAVGVGGTIVAGYALTFLTRLRSTAQTTGKYMFDGSGSQESR